MEYQQSTTWLSIDYLFLNYPLQGGIFTPLHLYPLEKLMTKRFLTLTLLLACIFVMAAADKKAKLIFHTSFDRFTADADVAGGDKKSSLKANLELRATKGIRKSGLLMEKGERCRYKIAKNFNMKSATISMWVTPLNWGWQDKRYQYFFQASDRTVPFRIQLYVPGSYTGGGGIGLYCQFGKRKTSGFKSFSVLAPLKWKPGEWHKIDASWDSTTMRVYIDGQQKAKKPLPNVEFPAMDKTYFHINPIWTGPKKITHDPGDRTIMDEFKVYDGVLSSEQIMQNYAADQAQLSGKISCPEALVPQISSKLKIDGKLNESTWKNATRIPIRVKQDSFVADRAAYASLLWDKKNLYIGFESPGKPKIQHKNHDGKLWEDDSFELFIWPGKNKKEHYQFILNASGAVFDAIGKNKKWNSKYQSRAYIGKNKWSLEVVIPFSNFGKAPTDGTVWKAQICRDWYRKPPFQPQYIAWANFMGGFEKGHGYLNFSNRKSGVKLTLGSGINAGSVALDVINPSASAVTCSWKVKSSHKQSVDGSISVAGRNKGVKKLSFKGFKDSTAEFRIVDPKSNLLLMLYPVHFFVKEPVEVEFIPYVLEKKLTVEADVSNLSDAFLQMLDTGSVKLNIKTIAPNKKTSEKSFTVKSIKGAYTIPVDWVNGKYNFVFTVSAPGLTSVSNSASLLKPPTPWLTSKTGITNQVLKPWTPLKYNADGSISIWNRTYKLNGPFPTKVINAKREQLTGPVTMTLATAKGKASFSVTSNKQVMKQPNRAEFKGTGVFGKLGGSVKFDTFMEYDGLTATTMTITPPKGGWNIKSLTMTVPLRKDLVKAIRKPKRQKWDGKKWESSFEPYIWVGNEYEGFDCFFNSDANWNYTERQKPVVISVNAKRALITYKIVMKPAKVTKPLKYIFGFQATPVKSIIKNWRAVNNMTRPWWKGVTINNWNTVYSKQMGLPDVAMPAASVKYLKEKFHDKGIQTFLYVGSCSTPDSNPSFDFFQKKWSNPFGATFYNMRTPKRPFNPGSQKAYALQPVSHNSSYTDYVMWYTNKALDQLPTANIYTDMDRLLPDKNNYHNSGYKDDAFGRSGVTYDILGRRGFYKRLLTICRNHKNHNGSYGKRWNHAHDAMVLPYHAFNDYFYPGEQFSHNLYKNDWFYVNDLDPKAWRYELGNRSSGISHVFLPQFIRGSKKKSDEKRPELADSLITIGLLNDVVISGSYCNQGAVEEYWALRKVSGITGPNVKSFCYWEKGCPVKAIGNRAHASVYKTSRGAAIGVGNFLGKAQTVKVKVDLAKLGLAGKKLTVKDLRSGKVLKLKNGSFSVPIKSRNYTIVTLTK
jgi:Concanavalin A-like lectin/glucanases superfamily/Carbohydrate family 9 binding domain-like/Glycoside hydrolase 123, N-terminal domain